MSSFLFASPPSATALHLYWQPSFAFLEIYIVYLRIKFDMLLLQSCTHLGKYIVWVGIFLASKSDMVAAFLKNKLSSFLRLYLCSYTEFQSIHFLEYIAIAPQNFQYLSYTLTKILTLNAGEGRKKVLHMVLRQHPHKTQ